MLKIAVIALCVIVVTALIAGAIASRATTRSSEVNPMNTADAWIICTGIVCFTILIIFFRIKNGP